MLPPPQASHQSTESDALAGPARRRQPRRWVRAAVALTSATALLATAALVATAAIVPPIGARRSALAATRQELETQLRPNERLLASTLVSQRRWTDLWRESFGIIAATDERLLHIGEQPTPLLRPLDDGPSELLIDSYPYTAAFTLEPRTLLKGYGRGLVLRTPTSKTDFLVENGAWESARLVARTSAAARRTVTQDIVQLEQATRSPAPAAEEYRPYVVQRGENLTTIARKFRTSPDVLRQLNRLTIDDIRAGQRLRVPRVVPMRSDSAPIASRTECADCRYWPSTIAKTSGATMLASDSMMNFGVSIPSLPHVIFSFGTAPE